MSDPREPDDAKAPQPGRGDAAEKPPATKRLKKPTREDRLAKALRENLKRRKAPGKKD